MSKTDMALKFIIESGNFQESQCLKINEDVP